MQYLIARIPIPPSVGALALRQQMIYAVRERRRAMAESGKRSPAAVQAAGDFYAAMARAIETAEVMTDPPCALGQCPAKKRGS